jgi:hypothetical protein
LLASVLFTKLRIIDSTAEQIAQQTFAVEKRKTCLININIMHSFFILMRTLEIIVCKLSSQHTDQDKEKRMKNNQRNFAMIKICVGNLII